MLVDWNILSDDMQLVLSREALNRASDIIADQADALAGEMETGSLADFDGPAALRLLADIVRLNGRETLGTHGTA